LKYVVFLSLNLKQELGYGKNFDRR
jgi:hypothetical protein